jgi:PleD family two-component response regulator
VEKLNTMALILIVEDDPEINSLIALALRVEDYNVIQARDGEQALQKVHEHAPDLILLDVMMPRMSGYEVARALQDKPSSANIPIIFVTAKPKWKSAFLVSKWPSITVCKPFQAQELLARVRAALRMRKLQEELRVSNEQLTHLGFDRPANTFVQPAPFRCSTRRRIASRTAIWTSSFRSAVRSGSFQIGKRPLGSRAGRRRFASLWRCAESLVAAHPIRWHASGGEEFAVILPATEERGAVSFAEKVRAATEAATIPCRTREGRADEPIRITVSAGVAIANLESSGDDVSVLATAIVRAADCGLYKSKAADATAFPFKPSTSKQSACSEEIEPAQFSAA